jgi:hypothetical protein
MNKSAHLIPFPLGQYSLQFVLYLTFLLIIENEKSKAWQINLFEAKVTSAKKEKERDQK